MEEMVYLNGALVPRSQANVAVADYGFLYGYGLFETMRAYKGTIFLLDRHLQRLMKSAALLHMDSGISVEKLAVACYETLRANGLLEARLRLTVSRGAAGPFPGTGAAPPSTMLVVATPFSPPPEEIYHKGLTVVLSSLRRDSQSLLSRLKTTSYLASVLARMEAEAAGADEALLRNERGFIVEGSASNIFFVQQAKLSTPSAESGILPGITREAVMELARSLKIDVQECEVRLDEFGDYEEVFLTNSVMELMPLVRVEDREGRAFLIGAGKPGPVTRKLMAAYRRMVARETGD